MQHRLKQIQEQSCKQPSSSVRSGPLGHYCSLLVLPLPPTLPASPLLKEPRKYQGLGKLVCLPFLTAVRMGSFSLGEPIPSAVKSIIGMTCGPDKIANLQPTPDPLPVGWNLEACLDQTEGKFVQQVDTFRARAEYTPARQLKEEDVGTWHTRVLQLHTPRLARGSGPRDVSRVNR
jgi:hypothetical protein